jgi:hypothetical protein
MCRAAADQACAYMVQNMSAPDSLSLRTAFGPLPNSVINEGKYAGHPRLRKLGKVICNRPMNVLEETLLPGRFNCSQIYQSEDDNLTISRQSLRHVASVERLIFAGS